ncbi:MAG TPA: serine/threonine protein kinase [Polyangiaceae bacterium]|nr:serine/threonine protein kinase [Polyangiaceae bacterium]
MSEAKTHRLMPDTIFAGRYRIVSSIGEGAMGTVYLAEVVDRDEERCAIKVLKPKIASEHSKGTERFAREAKVGERIGSPHVVDVLDAGFDEATGLHWLAMEYLEGLHLTEFIHEHDPSVAVRHRLLDQLFDAIAAAHRAGVVHRDLKPDNIFVVGPDDEPTVKVLDFGVAKTLREQMHASQTEGGLGTPLWTAPEQGKGGEHIRPSVDVWALGLLTFHVLTGKLFWFHANDDRSSMLDIATEMLRDAIPPASERAKQLDVADRIPPHLDGWLARCVVREAEERFANAGEAHAGLKEVLAGRPSPMAAPKTGDAEHAALTPKTPARTGHDTLPPTKRRGAKPSTGIGLVVALVAAVVAAVAISAWAWL